MANIISYFVFIFRLFKIRFFPPPEFSKQLLDELFVTSRIIKVDGGKDYQLKPKAEADNPYQDLDYSGNHTQKKCFYLH